MTDKENQNRNEEFDQLGDLGDHQEDPLQFDANNTNLKNNTMSQNKGNGSNLIPNSV